MSSLRLALKQSLEESGGGHEPPAPAPSPTPHVSHRAHKPHRKRLPGEPPRKRGRPRKHPLPQPQPEPRGNSMAHSHSQEHADFSSENEFDSDDHGSKEQHHHHSAANKIQSHWKSKQSSKPSERQRNKEASPGRSEQHKERAKHDEHESKPAAVVPDGEEDASAVVHKRKKKSRKDGDEDEAAEGKKKSKTVPAPSLEVVEHLRDHVSVKRARKYVAPGLRVKVRFATVRPGKPKRKRWYGGRISAVSKEGSKIRIKYDDGTTEVTKFPDKDVVIDATQNGEHAADATKFLPPPESAERREQPAVHEPAVERSEPVAQEPAVVKAKSEALASNSPHETKTKPHDTSSTPASAPKPKRKRGRPPKHKPPVVVEAPIVTASEVPTSGTEATVVTTKRNDEPQEKTKEAAEPQKGEVEDSLAAVDKKTHDHDELLTNKMPSSESPLVESSKRKSETDAMDQAAEQVAAEESKHPEEERSTKEEPVAASAPKLKIRIPARKKEEESLQQQQGSASPQEDHLVSKEEEVETEEEGEIAPDVVMTDASERDESVTKTNELNDDDDEHHKSKKRSLDIDSETMIQPPSKRLHIHIPSVKKGTTEETKEHSEPEKEPEEAVEDDVAAEQSVEKEAALKPRAPDEQTALTEYVPPLAAKTDVPVDKAPLSPRQKKKKRKQLEQAASDDLPNAPFVPEESTLPQSKEPKSGKEDVDASHPLTVAPAVENAKKQDQNADTNLDLSKESAFENKPSLSVAVPGEVMSEQARAKPLTPRERSKKDKDESAPISRSGRRAAQQANQRIVSRQEVVIQDPFAKKKRKRGNRREGEADDSDESEDAPQWVQCDLCGKWRIIPGSAVANLPNQWYCADNLWDPKRQSCDAPEQTQKQLAKEKRKKKRQRLLQQQQADANAAGEAGESKDGSQLQSIKEESSGKDSAVVAPKAPREPSPSNQSGADMDSGSDHRKAEKKSSLGKKGRSQESLEALGTDGEVVVKRKPGRPRRAARDVSENTSTTAQSQIEDADNLEWVQCEKCDKWRKLPPHVSADELPDVWYCDMNTWNPASASCDAAEDKAEGLQDTGIFGVSGSKLSYRNLIFGQTGRKHNRPISERTRAAESLFAAPSDDDDTPPTVMYASSSAFVSRNRQNLADENEGMSVLELMSRSNLWTELRGNAQPSVVTSSGDVNKKRVPLCSFDSLSTNMQEALKDMLVHSIDTKTLSGDDVLLEAQCRQWENAPKAWIEVRPYCSLNLVVTALCELVKEGRVELVQRLGPNWSIKDWNPKYRLPNSRQTSSKSSEASDDPSPLTATSMPISSKVVKGNDDASRCMKLSKPWKRGRVQ